MTICNVTQVEMIRIGKMNQMNKNTISEGRKKGRTARAIALAMGLILCVTSVNMAAFAVTEVNQSEMLGETGEAIACSDVDLGAPIPTTSEEPEMPEVAEIPAVSETSDNSSVPEISISATTDSGTESESGTGLNAESNIVLNSNLQDNTGSEVVDMSALNPADGELFDENGLLTEQVNPNANIQSAEDSADSVIEQTEQSATVDDVVVTVTADKGVFPDGWEVEARKVTLQEENEVAEAIDEVRDESKNVALSYTFDITIRDNNGNELQPDTSKGSVKVTFKMAEIANENLETEVYHVEETDEGLSAEGLIIETAEDIYSDTEADKKDVTEEAEKDIEEDEIVVETDGFSYYTVEFTYGKLQYVLEGDKRVELSVILDEVEIKENGEITKVEGSNDELFKPVCEEGIWYIEAVSAFSDEQSLEVTIGEVTYTIKVTDAITGPTVHVQTYSELVSAIGTASVTKIIVDKNINVPCETVTSTSGGKTAQININRSLVIEGANRNITIKRVAASGAIVNNLVSIFEIEGNNSTTNNIEVIIRNITIHGGSSDFTASNPPGTVDSCAGRSIIDVFKLATLTVENATIQNGIETNHVSTHRLETGAYGYGGAIRVDYHINGNMAGGTVNIKVGTIIKTCMATVANSGAIGGAIGCFNKGHLNLYGGTITNCYAQMGGALGTNGRKGVDYNTAGTISMYGGEISNCYAARGGAIAYLRGTSQTPSYIYGGKISNCHSGVNVPSGQTSEGDAISIDASWREMNEKIEVTFPKKDSNMLIIENCTGHTNNTATSKSGGNHGYSGVYLFNNDSTDNKILIADTVSVKFMLSDTEQYGELVIKKGTSAGVSFPGDPIKAGYIFAGWYKKGDSTKTKVTKDTVFSSNVTLMPMWCHNFAFSAQDNKLKATCSNSYCRLTGKSVSLTINANDMVYTGNSYSGASIDGSYAWVEENLTLPTIQYQGVDGTSYNLSTTPPKNVGTYKAIIKQGNIEAFKKFSIIRKQRSGISVSMSDYVYGTSESLPKPALSPAQADTLEVTFYYNTENSKSGSTKWENMTSVSLDADTYYMYAVIAETDVYQEYITEISEFKVQKAMHIITAPTAESNLVYNENEQLLIGGGECSSGTIMYSLDNMNYTDDYTAIKGTDSKKYTVYYKVEETDNYNAYGPKDIEVEIKKATVEITAVPTTAYSYGEKLSEHDPNGGVAKSDGKEIDGTFAWAVSDPDMVPQVSDSDSTEYGVLFTPLNVNYETVDCKTTITVTPMDAADVYAEVNIGKDSTGSREVRETLTDIKGKNLVIDKDYDKKVDKEETEKGTEYTITYSLKGNYTGTITKKKTVPKKAEDPAEPDNPEDDIEFVIEDESITELEPVVKGVTERKVKSVIESDISMPEKKAEIETQLADASSTYGSVEEVIDKLEESAPTDFSVQSNLVLEIKKIDDVSVDEEEKIKEEVAKYNSSSLIEYLDISMLVSYTIYEGDKVIIQMPNQPVHDTETILGDGKNFKSNITIDIPVSLRTGIPQGKRRTYYVARLHDDNVTILANTTDKRITFETGMFSTYALFYKDVNIPEEEEPSSSGNNAAPAQIAQPPIIMTNGYVSPKTGDSYEVYAFVGLLVVGMGLMIFAQRKRKENS